MVSVTQHVSSEWQRWDPQPILSAISPLESVYRGLNSDHLLEVHVDPEFQGTFSGIGIFADAVKARI